MSFLATKTAKDIVKEGSLDAVKIGAAETYFSAFGVYLGGTPLQIGALATLPPLIGSLAQSWGMRLSEQIKSRRDLIARFMKIQAILCLPIGLIPFFLGSTWWGVFALIALITLYHITIGLIAPMWNSLVGDLIPPTSRGEFFGFRNKWMSIVTFGGVFAAGQFVHFCSARDQTALGFLIVFCLGAISRFMAGLIFRHVPDVMLHVPDDSKFTFWQFILRARHSNFVKFVFFVSSMNFAASISGPYFAMYMLKDLAFSYHEYTVVVAAVVLAQFAVMRAWGSLSDQFGNRQILRVCGLLVSINPFLWLLSSNIWFVVFVQLYSGIFWAGFTLATANFVFDAVTPQKRARCFAYQSIVNGTLVFLGSALGGYMASHVSVGIGERLAVFVAESRFLPLFVASGILRLFTMVVLFPTFSEVRRVQKIRGHHMLIRVISLRPLWGATFGFVANRYSRRGRSID